MEDEVPTFSDIPREDYIPPRFVAEAFAEASRMGMQPGMRKVGTGVKRYGRQVLERYYPEVDFQVFSPGGYRKNDEKIPLTYICSKCHGRSKIIPGGQILCRHCKQRRQAKWRDAHREELRVRDRERKRVARASSSLTTTTTSTASFPQEQ